MDEEEIAEAEGLELRMSVMKSQFQQSYDIFMKAHEELSKITFDSSTFPPGSGSLGPLMQLETNDVNEIVGAGSIDGSISILRAKMGKNDADNLNTFPDVKKLLSIMNGLKIDIESLNENQKKFAKLSEEVNNEMNMFEKRMEDSISQLDDLVVESLDNSETSQFYDDQEEDDDDEEEATIGSESLSDWGSIKKFQWTFTFFLCFNFQATNLIVS